MQAAEAVEDGHLEPSEALGCSVRGCGMSGMSQFFFLGGVAVQNDDGFQLYGVFFFF